MTKGIQQVFVTALDANDSTAKEKLGTIRFDSTGKIYKYIQYYNGAAVAAVAGEVAYYVADTGYAANQVTEDLSGSDEIGAGVLQAALTDQYYGWMQIKGHAILTIALTAGADGDPLTPTGSTDGSLDVSALATDHVCAHAGDISAMEILCDFPW
jgi:hypothetical protein